MARYGMVIELSRCIGCSTCVIACKMKHSMPPGILLTRLLLKEYGQYPTVKKVLVPVLCNHCKDAACVDVCPTGATSKLEDGTVTVDNDKCMGCRYCLIACPYGARSYLSAIDDYFPGQCQTAPEVIGYEQLQKGVVTKCDFCHDIVAQGLHQGLKPGEDREATPVCVIDCPVQARHFGDLDDPYSEVSHLIRARRGYQLHSEFGTDPSVYYVD